MFAEVVRKELAGVCSRDAPKMVLYAIRESLTPQLRNVVDDLPRETWSPRPG